MFRNRSSASRRLHDRPVQLLLQFRRRVVVAIDVATDATPAQQVQVIAAGEQAHVIDLRNSRHEALNGARDEVRGVAAAERIVEGAIDLV